MQGIKKKAISGFETSILVHFMLFSFSILYSVPLVDHLIKHLVTVCRSNSCETKAQSVLDSFFFIYSWLYMISNRANISNRVISFTQI